jgi:hypothetical protein
MEFKDSYARLYNALLHEYRLNSFFNGRFHSFVNYKDIGLKFNKAGGGYEIVDKKKWMLAKIKYGI